MVVAVAGLLLAAGGALAAGDGGRSGGASAGAGGAATTTTPTVSVRGKVETSSEHGALETAVEWVQIVGAALALASLLVIARQVRLSTVEARQERTAQLQAVWDEREFRSIVSRVLPFLTVADAGECIDKIAAWSRIADSEDHALPGYTHPKPLGKERPRASQNDVFHVVGFFEDLCLRYNEQQLDRRWVALSIGPGLLQMLQVGFWFVHFLRQEESGQTDELLLREWAVTVKDLCADRTRAWQKPDHPVFTKLRHAVEARQPVRVICLPGGDLGQASDADWALARRASEVLAGEGARRAALRQRSAPPRGSQKGWRVILVPSRVDASAAQLAADHDEAAELTKRLGPLDDVDLDAVLLELRS